MTAIEEIRKHTTGDPNYIGKHRSDAPGEYSFFTGHDGCAMSGEPTFRVNTTALLAYFARLPS